MSMNSSSRDDAATRSYGAGSSAGKRNLPDISVRMRARSRVRQTMSRARALREKGAMHKRIVASIILATIVGVPSPSAAQDIPAEYQQVLSTLGTPGGSNDHV